MIFAFVLKCPSFIFKRQTYEITTEKLVPYHKETLSLSLNSSHN